MAKTYECHNKNCDLGASNPWQLGRFSGGRSKAQTRVFGILTIRGEPAYGPGICPNCGEKGKEI